MVQWDGVRSNRANAGLDHRVITAGRKERETNMQSETARRRDVEPRVVCVRVRASTNVKKSSVHARKQTGGIEHACNTYTRC